MISDGSRSVQYNPSNRVTEIVSDPMPSQGNDTGTVDLMYGADQNRVVQSVASNGTTTRTVYVGLGNSGKSLYERISKQTGTTTTVVHANYIYASGMHGGNAFALRVLSDIDGSVNETRYYSFDHLGSVTAMSDEEGRVAGTEQDATLLAYDVWGGRRNPDESAAVSTSFTLPTGNREFTGQELIPDVGLVNMNGRVYNPSLGRFLSADPNIQDVSDLQSYNRYSYVLNNPLRYTDPTGFFWSQVWDGLKGNLESPMFWYGLAFTTLGCVVGGPAGCLAAGLEMAAFDATVTLSMGLSNGNFEQSLLVAGIGLGVGIASSELPGLKPLIGLALGSASAAAIEAVDYRIENGKWSGAGASILDAAVMSAAEGALTMAALKVHALSVAQAAAEGTAAGKAGWIASETVNKGDPNPSMVEVGAPGNAWKAYQQRMAALTPWEQALKQADPNRFYAAYLDGYIAYKQTTMWFSLDQMANGTAGNAFQHAYWSAIMTRDLGADYAIEMGYAHEAYAGYANGGYVSPDEKYDSEMDLFNDHAGVDIGKKDYPYGQVKYEVLGALKAGQLFWYINVTPYSCPPQCNTSVVQPRSI